MLNKIITISEVATKKTQSGKQQLKIKDQAGKTYTLWLTKSDGACTQAYEYIRQLANNGLGKTVEIAYKEETIEGYQYPLRTILMVKEAPSNAAPQATGGSTRLQTAKPVSNRDFEKEAWGKCKHAFLIEAYKQGQPLATAEPEAEKWADMSMRKLDKPIVRDSALNDFERDDIDYSDMDYDDMNPESKV